MLDVLGRVSATVQRTSPSRVMAVCLGRLVYTGREAVGAAAEALTWLPRRF